MTISASAAKQQGATLTAAAPGLERIEQIQNRLIAIDADDRALDQGFLPKADLTARLLAFFRHHRDEFERPLQSGYDMRTTVWPILAALTLDDDPTRLRVSAPDQFVLLVWALFPLLETTVPAAVAGLSYQEGLGREDRQRQRAALQEERLQLLSEHETLVEEVNAIGAGQLAVQHLPEAADRRATEARQREAQAELVAERRRRQAELNSRYERRVQANRSQYLESNRPIRDQITAETRRL